MADFESIIRQLQQQSQTGDPQVDALRAQGKDPNLARSGSGRFYRSRDYELNRLMEMLQQGGTGIMGAIQGIRPDVTQEDIDLIQKLQQATLAPGLAQISGNAGARGLTGSSIEGVQRGQFAAQTALGSQAQLQNMAFQRAGMDLNRQQILFNTLINSVQPQIETIEASKNRGMQQKQQGGWGRRVAGGLLGAGAGFLTGGPGGALAGAASGFTGQNFAMPQQQPAPASDLPWDWRPY